MATSSVSVIGQFEPREAFEVESTGNGLVLTTQDCDLVKPEATVPVLEVVSCFSDPAQARGIRTNNSRFFVMDRDSGTIADRAYKYPITREALGRVEAPAELPFGGDRSRGRAFARWLALAYDRPALPDEVHPDLAVPLARSIGRALARGQEYEWLNEQLIEVRISANFTEAPPWRADLLFVLSDSADIEHCQAALADIVAASGLLEPALTACAVLGSWTTGTPRTTSISDYSASYPISIEEVSYRDGEQIAPIPLRSDSA